MIRITKFMLLLFCFLLSFSRLSAEGFPGDWAQLEPGFSIQVFDSPVKSRLGDSRITVLKIDPEKFDFEIYCASQYNNKLRTVKEWAQDFNLVAAINAGMFAKDYLTSVGFLKSGDHVNNPTVNHSYNCVFACGPLEDGLPAARIIDRQCENFPDLRKKYRSFVQGIRMISCHQKNVWEQQPNQWSIAALGFDKGGNILFIHCRSPYTVHDFINILLKLPLEIRNAMYLEGGPPASLYYSLQGLQNELAGSYETDFLLNNNNQISWQIPNVIGVKKKSGN